MAVVKHWPLIAALAVLYAVVGSRLLACLEQTDGHLVYVIDDPYIHMAAAKNLVEHGVFGVTRYGYSSSSSSIIWPLLLSLAYALQGTNAVAPLVLNVLCATALLGLAYLLLRKQGIPAGLNCVYLLILMFCTPLPVLIFLGMEHTLHVVLAIAMLYVAAQFVSQQPPGGRPASPATKRLCLALAPLLTMARYEGALMIAVVCLLLAVRRRFKDAALLAALGAAPVIVNGLVSVHNGWFLLPNSVVLKGRVPSAGLLTRVGASLGSAASGLSSQPLALAAIVAGLPVLVLACHRLYRKGLRPWADVGVRVALATIAGLLLAAVLLPRIRDRAGYWFSRHEPYLMGSGLLVGVLLLVFLYRKEGRGWTTGKAMLWILGGTTVLHVQLAGLGWFYRYEAYLVACGMLVVFMFTYHDFLRQAAFSFARRHMLAYTAVGLAVVVLAYRGGKSWASIPPASRNIYEQQYQMAAFLKEYYSGQSVVANDIGAISFFTDVDNLDILGLGSLDVARARLAGTYGTDTIKALAASRGARIAVVYEAWFEIFGDGPPAGWQEVGQWQIAGNVSCANPRVSFYAVRPDERDNLAENLRKFSERLPRTVTQRGPYLTPIDSSVRLATGPDDGERSRCR